MPPDQMRALVGSIERFGIVDPIIINQKNLVIGGHQRVEAGKSLGLKEVPVIRVKVSEREMKTLNLALNRISGEWDEAKLAPILAELEAFPEINLTGFTQKEIDEITAPLNPPEEEEDTIPEPPVEPITRTGDLWQLDKHRLLCGDSTKPEDVDHLTGGASITLIATDPPYGVNLDQSWRDSLVQPVASGNASKIAGDSGFGWGDAFLRVPATVLYCWHASSNAHIVREIIEKAGYEIKQQIIWVKDHFTLSRQCYHWKHEPCHFAVRKGCTIPWNGDRTQTTVWEAQSPNQPWGRKDEIQTEHPTQKPVLLFEIPIKNHLKEGEVVYDPFLGSGTTLIAAQQLGRVCYGIEIEPKYCDVAVKRWENYTSKKAERIGKETS